MPERYKILLKIVCYALAAVLVYQLAMVVVQLNPLTRVKIPELPSLPGQSAEKAPPINPTPAPTAVVPKGQGTNGAAQSPGTNGAVAVMPANTQGTTSNSLAGAGTNPFNSTTVINPAAPLKAAVEPTNSGAAPRMAAMSTNLATNSAADATVKTNGTNSTVMPSATNLVPVARGGNSVRPVAVGGPVMAGLPPGFNPAQMPGMPPRAAALPPPVQARVDRITDSEILGMVIRPQPMALMGIAGNFAFLRAPTGQTGMVKEGEDLGGVKLLKIGINRVLVEDNGQKKELTIFSGAGGESLMPKPEAPHETNN